MAVSRTEWCVRGVAPETAASIRILSRGVLIYLLRDIFLLEMILFRLKQFREAREELGVTLYENEFIYCGQRCFLNFRRISMANSFRDCQV